MVTRLFNTHDISEQIDTLRRAVRELMRRHGPVPPEMSESHDWDFELREAERLAKEADLAAAQAEQAKQALAAAQAHAKEVSKPPAQKAADIAAGKAQADLEAKVKAAEEASAAAKAAHAEAAGVAKVSQKGEAEAAKSETKRAH